MLAVNMKADENSLKKFAIFIEIDICQCQYINMYIENFDAQSH